MKSYRKKNKNGELTTYIQENSAQGIFTQDEEARLREAIYESDIEKLRSFTRMLRTNAMLNRAVVTHKK